nr:MAG TPA: hypothetical protein [Bacteriophage sp.]DAQ35540.1 MAG TPA: hypothetical protein [Caudoviricetes sp.]
MIAGTLRKYQEKGGETFIFVSNNCNYICNQA